jgi:photosystem II stability/assembly factor-like uncharacterized protein
MKRTTTLTALALMCAPLAVPVGVRATEPAKQEKPKETPKETAKVKVDSNTFGALTARPIGPASMSGRIAAIDVVNNNPRTLYVGAGGGGLWKSINGGLTFKPVFDKHTQSIGAIAIDQSKPDTVWVGTGEAWTRNSVSVGTGVYKTTDGGENWTSLGLENSERIVKIVIDPRDSNTAYVAVVGKLWSASEDRGLYKTTDGGKTWSKILYINADTGCSDVVLDPQEPNTVYAGMWQFRRQPWTFNSGGPGSGIHKSTDGGKTWKKVTNGLPTSDLGRIALAVAPTRPNLIYANVESKKTALYVSEDLGESWKVVNDANGSVKGRPFYFSLLVVDPKDYKKVYKPATSTAVSRDGGKTFTGIANSTHSDHHALWINPNNPNHMFLGTDGGVYESVDGGNAFRFLRGLPVSQFYHVYADNQSPYNVYGGLQDNGTWTAPSRKSGGINNSDWKNVGFGDGFWAFSDPTDNNLIYVESQGGNLARYHRNTGESKFIAPARKEGEPKLRFNWNTPLVPGRKNPGNVYVGAQFLYRSKDKGESWERISPDLTTNDPAKQKQDESGGLTIDNSTAENHCTIFAISESPLDEKVVWVGTDDGNVQVTRDGGKTWTNVTENLTGLPKNTWCSSVEASKYALGTAYATFDGHQTGDMKTYIYKTTDFGKTWTPIVGGEIKGYAHVIREDSVNANLLFAGTEFGLFVSIDGGEIWSKFTGGLPNVAVRDIFVHQRDGDLILATHGRGVYIVDDISPLRQLTAQVLDAPVAFFQTRPAILSQTIISQGFPGDDEYVGETVPDAAYITYYLKERHIVGDFKVEVYDAEGKLVSTLPGGKRRGINRVEWQTRLKPPKVPRSEAGGAPLFGPNLLEGTYTVKLLKGKETYTGTITLAADPKSPHTPADRKLKQVTQLKLYDLLGTLSYTDAATVDARDKARAQAKKLESDAGAKDLVAQLKALADKLDELHKSFVATKEGAITGEEQLREDLANLYQYISFYGGKPTQSQLSLVPVYERRVDKGKADLAAIFAGDIAAVNAKLTERKLPTITMLTKEEFDKRQ